MVQEDYKKWQAWLNGERFAWDAPNHPSEMNVIANKEDVIFVHILLLLRNHAGLNNSP